MAQFTHQNRISIKNKSAISIDVGHCRKSYTAQRVSVSPKKQHNLLSWLPNVRPIFFRSSLGLLFTASATRPAFPIKAIAETPIHSIDRVYYLIAFEDPIRGSLNLC